MAVKTDTNTSSISRISGLVSTTPTLAPKNKTGRFRESHGMNNDVGVHLDAITSNVPTCSTVLDLTVLKGDSLDRAINTLVRTLFPKLLGPSDRLRIRRVSGALTNAVYFLSIRNVTLLLRVYGIGCDQIIDRANELCWLARLSQLGLGPRLLAIFGNGRFEEYLPSTTLTRSDIRHPVLSQRLAARLYQLHQIVRLYPPSSSSCHLTVWHNIDTWFRHVQQLLPELQEQHHRLIDFDFSRLGHEIQLCKSLLEKQKSPIVFGHNDTQYGNVLRLKDTDDLVVVDFEYAGFNPRGYDLANHFCEWMYDYHGNTPACMQPEKFPTKEERLRFLKAYLEKGGEDASLAEALDDETMLWVMASHLHWGLWGLIQANQSEIDFDYLTYSLERLHAFRHELARYKQ